MNPEKSDSMEEKQLSSRSVYRGVLLDAYSDEILLPDGKKGIREVIRHPGAVCILPLTEQDEVITVSQYRYPHAKVLLEIPAGKLNSREENPLAAARRELQEETGATADTMHELGLLYTTPAFVDEVIHMYVATGLHFGQPHPDDDEFLSLDRIPLETLADMVLRGEVPDAKTQAIVMRVWAMKQKHLL